MLLRIIFFILFISVISRADSNRMLPLAEEQLPNDIILQCGLIIKEWRGPRKIDIKKLNHLCNLSVNHFPAFIKRFKKISIENNLPFVWRGSFIPSQSCHRCLNDMVDRFSKRLIKDELSGYTDYYIGYSFIGIDKKEFDTIFVHELFHALASYYDVLFSEAEDERLAMWFTESLGLGR